ncbi:MAG: tyrosine-type recombinase/integrase [Acidimicrobiales bacterium]|nr:tyrosine-type recombinase/integrase [Acidimicrobiales bacterium]
MLDRYVAFVASRCRPNTVRATVSDLRAFFAVITKDALAVTTADVFAFIPAQREPKPGRSNVIRLGDGGQGLSSRTIQRRLATMSGFFGHLVMLDELAVSPVPQGLSTRRSRSRRGGTVALVRSPRTLPKIVEPDEVTAVFAALRKHRDRAMVEAMVLGGLRRCEVLGLRFEDLRPGEGRVFIAEGKGGHQRLIPMSQRFFRSVARYLDAERPADASSDRVFSVLKGPTRGQPLSEDGLDRIVGDARRRAGLVHGSCHELRHTCLTRLREAGMALEAVQAQAGHRSIESTHLPAPRQRLARRRVSPRCCVDRRRPSGGEPVTAVEVDVVDEPERASGRGWAAIAMRAPQLAVTGRRYLAQIGVSLQRRSVEAADNTLRLFVAFLTDEHPDVRAFAKCGGSTSRTSRPGCVLVAHPAARR